MRLISLRLAILLAAGASAQAPEPPRFDAIRFFTGATEGVGRFKVVFRSAKAVRVEGHGRVEYGVLVLDQRIAREGAAPTTRQWRIREVAPGRYTGTLTDARGPITGESVGGRLRLNYTSTGGYAVEQWLTLAPDGRSAHNRLTAKKLGVTVATLDETIRKTD